MEAEEEAEAEAAAGHQLLRNLSIIAHVDHGKTTLSDCLLAAAGQLSERRAGDACALDKGLEATRGITIYSSAVALSYPARGLLLNLVDCPGHAEYNSEVWRHSMA
jgi:translation elongation factor EF-4